jgi:hypothetical protein
MYGAEYDLVFLLHRLCYAQRPLTAQDIHGADEQAALKLAQARGFVRDAPPDSRPSALLVSEAGLVFLGRTANRSILSRLGTWLSNRSDDAPRQVERAAPRAARA